MFIRKNSLKPILLYEKWLIFSTGISSSPKQPQYNKAVLTVAAEIMALPNEDVRKGVYYLIRTINKSWDEQDSHQEEQDQKARA